MKKNIEQKGLAPRSPRGEVGQAMLLTVMLLTGVILSTTSLAALITLYQMRQATDVASSNQAIFAADAGIECALYSIKNPSQNCSEGKLTNGAEFKTVAEGDTVKSVGKSRKSARAFEITVDTSPPAPPPLLPPFIPPPPGPSPPSPSPGQPGVTIYNDAEVSVGGQMPHEGPYGWITNGVMQPTPEAWSGSRVTSPVREGNYAIKLQLNDYTANTAPQYARIRYYHPGFQGDEDWWAWSLYIDPATPAQQNWFALWEYESANPPPALVRGDIMNLYGTGDRFTLTTRGGSALDGSNFRQVSTAFQGFEKGVWHDFIFHVRWSLNLDGYHQLWWRKSEKAFTLVADHQGVRTLYVNSTGNPAKASGPVVGLYRANDTVNANTAIVYYDNVWQGDNYAELEAAFGE